MQCELSKGLWYAPWRGLHKQYIYHRQLYARSFKQNHEAPRRQDEKTKRKQDDKTTERQDHKITEPQDDILARKHDNYSISFYLSGASPLSYFRVRMVRYFVVLSWWGAKTTWHKSPIIITYLMFSFIPGCSSLNI